MQISEDVFCNLCSLGDELSKGFTQELLLYSPHRSQEGCELWGMQRQKLKAKLRVMHNNKNTVNGNTTSNLGVRLRSSALCAFF